MFVQDLCRGNFHRFHIIRMFQPQPPVQPHGAHLAGESALDPGSRTDGNLRAAAADVDHPAAVRRQCCRSAQEAEFRFFFTGDDPERHACLPFHLFHELLSVRRVPGSARRKDRQLFRALLPDLGSHPSDSGNRLVHRVPVQVPCPVKAGKQTRTFPVPPQALEISAADVRQKASYRIGPDPDHGSSHGKPPQSFISSISICSSDSE